MGLSTPADLSDKNMYMSEEHSKYMLDCAGGLLGVNLALENFDTWQEALLNISPAGNVSITSPPTILAHGQMDTLIPSSNLNGLIGKLSEFGVHYSYFSYLNSGHGLDDIKDSDVNLSLNLKILEYMNLYMDW